MLGRWGEDTFGTASSESVADVRPARASPFVPPSLCGLDQDRQVDNVLRSPCSFLGSDHIVKIRHWNRLPMRFDDLRVTSKVLVTLGTAGNERNVELPVWGSEAPCPSASKRCRVVVKGQAFWNSGGPYPGLQFSQRPRQPLEVGGIRCWCEIDVSGAGNWCSLQLRGKCSDYDVFDAEPVEDGHDGFGIELLSSEGIAQRTRSRRSRAA
jgi:hypothetical protein